MSSQARQENQPDQLLAVITESLYIANMLFIPVIGFMIILWLYFRNRATASPLVLCHFRQTIRGSLWGYAMIAMLGIYIFSSMGFHSEKVWLPVMIYFEFVHIPLLILGFIGTIKALRNKMFKYPLIGVKCE